MFQAGTDQALADQITRPRPVAPTAPGFSFMDLVASPFQGIGGGVAKSLAFGSEVLGAFGQVAGAYPETLGPVILTPDQKKQAETQRRKLLVQGIDFSNEAGDTFRQRARDIMPDPQTTHASAQVVAGLTEFLTQAAGYTLTAGPVVGSTLLAGDVGLAEADRLKLQGVDEATRTKAGAVAGAVAGGSMIIPMSGATALTRFAKGAAVGEGSMIGQQVAEKAILSHAGYEKIADTFDPLDPVALAMGLVPGVIAARWGGKPVKPVKPAKTEAEMRSNAALSPAEQAASDAYEASAGNLRELEAAIAAEKDPKNRATLQAELAQQRAMAAAIRDNPDLVRAARVQQTAVALERSRLTPVDDLAGADAHVRAVETALDQIGRGEAVRVDDIVASRAIPTLDEFMAANKVPRERMPAEVLGDFLGFIKSAGGIDFAQKLDITGEPGGARSNPGGIFRKGGRSTDELAMLAEEAGYLRPGDGGDSGRLVDMVQRAVRGERVLTLAEQAQKAGRDEHLGMVADRLQNVESRLRSIGVDPTPAQGHVALLEAYAREHEPALLARALDDLANADRLDHVESNLPEPPPSRAAGAVDRAKVAHQDLQDSGKPLAEFLADSQHPPEVKNLLIGMDKAKDDAGRVRLLQDFETMARRDPTTPLMDLAADAVEGQGAKAPEQSAIDHAAAQVEALNPDMLVQLDGMDSPVRVADLMEQIKREAATDAEEAQLIQAAAECALRN